MRPCFFSQNVSGHTENEGEKKSNRPASTKKMENHIPNLSEFHLCSHMASHAFITPCQVPPHPHRVCYYRTPRRLLSDHRFLSK